jgi:hypothetical protein
MQHFTVEHANRALPLVRRIVEDIVEQHRRWRETILELDLLSQSARPEEQSARVEELVRQSREQSRELEAFQRELRQLGVQLKDSRLGLVDFPSEIGGRTVLLCWRLGEPEVQFWHEVNAGYAGRQPLSPALVS